MEVRSISIDDLTVAEENVRRDPASEAADAELVANIKAIGMLHPLTVQPNPEGGYAVVAGRRRLRAWQQIQAEDGGDAFEVLCVVLDNGSGVEASLAENSVRLAMHPADQVGAFAALAEAGATPEDIGNRFGLAPKTVKRRLRLGRLPGRVLAAWRAGEVNLDAVQALATTEKAEEAGHIFDHLLKEGAGHLQAWRVRQMIEQRRMSPRNDAARYVGLPAYRKAGGLVEETLFAVGGYYGGPAEKTSIADPVLMQRLALEKLERKAKREGKGWKWHRAALQWTWEDQQSYIEIPFTPAEATEEEAARMDALEQEAAQLQTTLDGIDPQDEARREVRRALEKLHGEQRAIEQAQLDRSDWTEEEKALAGVVVTLGNDGKPRVHAGLVAFEDHAAYYEMRGEEAPAKPRPEPVDEEAAAAAEKEKKAKGYPAAVVGDLKLLRGAAVRHALAEQPALARDVATFALARLSRFKKAGTWHSGINQPGLLRLDSPTDYGTEGSGPLQGDDCGPAVLEPQPGKAKLDWVSESNERKAWRAFMELSPAARGKVLAAVVADLLRPRPRGQHPVYEDLVKALDLAPAKAMAARGAQVGIHPLPVKVFWKRLTKDQILETARKELGAKWVDEHRGDKKAALVAAAAEAFAERNWLPKGF